MTTKVDLHMHSVYSVDGEFSPAELVAMARSKGLAAIAVCDHNNADGVPDALDSGRRAGIEVIPAIELNCSFQNAEFHVIGYFIDHRSEKIKKIYADIIDQEIRIARKRIRLVQNLGIDLELDEAMAKSQAGVVTGELIAELAFEHPNNVNNPLLLPYRPGGNRSDNPLVNFYWDFIAQDKPAYVPIEYIPMVEAIGLIKELGGQTYLAHPGHNLKGKMQLLDGILALGLQGIEAYSSYHTPEQNRFFVNLAKDLGLPFSGGSDFHGVTKPAIEMGRFGLEDDGLQMLANIKKTQP